MAPQRKILSLILVLAYLMLTIAAPVEETNVETGSEKDDLKTAEFWGWGGPFGGWGGFGWGGWGGPFGFWG